MDDRHIKKIKKMDKEDRISALPDCILSDILAMLSLKDSVKTSILSRRWCKLWALRRDLYFDIFSVLGTSENKLLHARYLVDVLNTFLIEPGFLFLGHTDIMEKHIDLDRSAGEFVKRVDHFVKNFQGTVVNSFRVNFRLDYKHTSAINQWIRFAIAKGVRIVDLLFLGRPYTPPGFTIHNPYKLDFSLFSQTNASTLNQLRLENCIVFHPTSFDFLPFNNLRSLSLEQVKLDATVIENLLYNCPQLEEFSLLICEFRPSMRRIVSSSLCHLKVRGCYFSSTLNSKLELNLILPDCLKLNSLEVDCLELTSSEDGLYTLNFNAPMLKSLKFSILLRQNLNTSVAATFFPELKIMHVTASSMVPTSVQITQPFKHLQQLNLLIFMDSYILDYVEYDPL